MPNRKARRKFKGDLFHTTHKLQPNEELRLIIGKAAITIRMASVGVVSTTWPTPTPKPSVRRRAKR
jgi:hypothetical protein